MNKKYIGLIFGAIAGMVVAVLLVNSGKNEGTHAFTAFDPTVKYTMTELYHAIKWIFSAIWIQHSGNVIFLEFSLAFPGISRTCSRTLLGHLPEF